MGIVNTTPDSFSDGGRYNTTDLALHHTRQLITDGAHIIDIGGESSRPGAESVSVEAELDRVIPLIQEIRSESDITISIDTTKSTVAKAALHAGADIINDISALRHDNEMLDVLLDSTSDIIIMHMQGTPQTMQENPIYLDAVNDVYDFLTERIEWLIKNGVAENRIIADPGIGFGKTLEHNLILLKGLSTFKDLGVRILLGHSRKKFLGEITGQLDATGRDTATAVTTALCASRHIDIVRVHNVSETRNALAIAEAIQLY